MTRLEKQMEFIDELVDEIDLIRDCVEDELFENIDSIITEVNKQVKDCKRFYDK